jgi:hypothetical protein
MLTRNKKQYAGSLIAREGNILHEPETDIKGLAIKKSSTNEYTREYFTELLEDEILNADEIDLSSILNKYKEFEDIVRTSLTEGEVTFSLPQKLNEESGYKFPFRMMQYRGSILWNHLYPEKYIDAPTKVNTLKLTADNEEDIERLKEDNYEIYEKLTEFVFDDEDMAHYGFTTISMPKDVTKVPEWIIPFIDVETLVGDNIRNAIILLESLGFQTLTVLGRDYYSNIISF